MDGILAIDQKEVEKQVGVRKWYLTRTHGFYDAVKSHDSSRSTGVLSSEANTSVNSLQTFLATYDVFKKSVASRIASTCTTVDPRSREQFVELFSVYAGAAAASSLISKTGSEVEQVPLPGKHQIDFSRGDYLILDDLVKTYTNGLNRATNGKVILSYANDLYGWIIEQAVQQQNSPKFEVLARQAESSSVQVDGIIIRGFNYASKSSIPDEVVKEIAREDYIGNTGLIEALENSITELFDYDFKEKKNPHLALGGFQQTFTLWGPGGTGKTSGIELVVGEAYKKAKKLGIPFHARQLKDFKNMYYGESEKAIGKFFDEINKGDAVNAVIIEDIDTVFFARESLKDSPADKAVLGKLMNTLEGFASPSLGNYVLFATSNHPLQGDGPLMDRLKQGQIEVKGAQNPDEYIAVFQSKLRHAVKSKCVAANNWGDIGSLAMKHGFSNRDIRNICLDVLTLTKKYDRPDNFHSMNYAQKSEFIANHRNQISGSAITDMMQKYAVATEAQKQKEFDEEVKRGVERLKVNAEILRQAKRLGI